MTQKNREKGPSLPPETKAQLVTIANKFQSFVDSLGATPNITNGIKTALADRSSEQYHKLDSLIVAIGTYKAQGGTRDALSAIPQMTRDVIDIIWR